MKENQLIKRVKSWLWRAGMLAIAAGLAAMVQDLSSLEISNPMVAILGLAMGELSKFINNKVSK